MNGDAIAGTVAGGTTEAVEKSISGAFAGLVQRIVDTADITTVVLVLVIFVLGFAFYWSLNRYSALVSQFNKTIMELLPVMRVMQAHMETNMRGNENILKALMANATALEKIELTLSQRDSRS